MSLLYTTDSFTISGYCYNGKGSHNPCGKPNVSDFCMNGTEFCPYFVRVERGSDGFTDDGNEILWEETSGGCRSYEGKDKDFEAWLENKNIR